MDIQVFFPEKAYPFLYEDVMSLKVFPDSKTFADAIPKTSPEEIDALYKKVDRSNLEAVLDFVLQWFELPQSSEEPHLKKQPLKEHIISLWNTLTKTPDRNSKWSSLIPLPYNYIVPGGRFREIYYWDSYFTMLGLKESGRTDIIKEMIKNFAWLMDQFGHIPNGNRSYFLSRSQPPFFSLMIELLAEVDGREALVHYQKHLLLEYDFWMDGGDKNSGVSKRVVKVGDDRFLNRYYDDNNIPRAESYSEDKKLFENSNSANKELYRELRAACESGWDFSSRWLDNSMGLASIHTTDKIPVDLNSLLYLLEKTIARSFLIDGHEQKANEFEARANIRMQLIHQMLWDDENGFYSDLNFPENKFGIPSLAMMYPLFAGIATQEQAEKTIRFASSHFLKPGGWITTNHHTGEQWDAPNGWAPLQWITFIGLKNYGAVDLAHEGTKRWLSLNEQVYNRTGRMMEKYNVEDLSLEAGGGEYPVQDGFGWTNGVYLALTKELNPHSAD